MSFESLAIWLCLVPFVLVAFAITLVVTASTMGSTATLKALPQLLAVFAIMTTAMAVFILLPDQLRMTVFDLVQLLILLLSVPLSIHQLRQRGRAGAVLLDLGHIRGYRLYQALFGAQIVMGLVLVVIALSSGLRDWRVLLHGLTMIALGVEFVLVKSQRTQLREGGIAYYGQLIPWSKVVTYRWESAETSVLTLRVRRILGKIMPMSFPVSAELAAGTDHVLAQRVQAVAPLAG